MKMKPLFLAMGMALSGSAFAQGLSLQACINQAWSDNPDIHASEYRIEQAEAALKEAQGHRMPKVNAQLNMVHTNDPLNVFGLKLGQASVTQADFNPALLNDPDAFTNINPRIEVQVPIYNGGKITGYINQANEYVGAAQFAKQAAQQQLGFHVVQAYEGVNTAQAYVQVAEQARQAAQSFVDVTENLVKQGLVVKSELLSAQVHLANVEVQKMQAQNQVDIALEQLSLLMGQSLDSQVALAGSASIEAPQGDLKALQQKAVDNNPQLNALRKQIASTQGAVEVARSSQKPSFNAMARYDWNYSDDLNQSNGAYTVGAMMNYNLFDFGTAQGSVDRAQAKKVELQSTLKQAENGIRFKVSEAWKRANEAKNRVRVHELGVERAQEATRLITQRYENGIATLTEVLASQARLDQANAELVGAKYELKVQNAALWLTVGELNPKNFAQEQSK